MMNLRILTCPLMLAMLFAIGGCAATGPGAGPDFVYAYSERYPLMGANVDRVDVSAFRPQVGDAARVRRIAGDFVRNGQNKIVIFVPQSGPGAMSSGNWVKQELVAQGVPPGRIQWDSRPLPDGIVRIAYAGQGGATRWDCTNLYEDVQQRADETSWLNREIVNFGCAYQSNMRAQVENPRDFVRPRPEGPMDPVHAANAVRQLRNGTAAQNNTAAQASTTPTGGTAP